MGSLRAPRVNLDALGRLLSEFTAFRKRPSRHSSLREKDTILRKTADIDLEAALECTTYTRYPKFMFTPQFPFSISLAFPCTVREGNTLQFVTQFVFKLMCLNSEVRTPNTGQHISTSAGRDSGFSFSKTSPAVHLVAELFSSRNRAFSSSQWEEPWGRKDTQLGSLHGDQSRDWRWCSLRQQG